MAAGKTSSFLLSSSNQLIFQGKSSDFMENEDMRSWDLFLVYGMQFLPVAISAKWNTKIECVYLRFIDVKDPFFGSKAQAKRLQKFLFGLFSK